VSHAQLVRAPLQKSGVVQLAIVSGVGDHVVARQLCRSTVVLEYQRLAAAHSIVIVNEENLQLCTRDA